MANIVLIGPPGVGKSTVGALLAKALAMPFIDTDIIIQSEEGRRLQDILDSEGIERFKQIEEKRILELDVKKHVIATGGSVVYSEDAMSHLQRSGYVVYLTLPHQLLFHRIKDLDTRGVVMPADQKFEEMLCERVPLYERYAEFTIDCEGLSHEKVVREIVRFVDGKRNPEDVK